MSRVAWFALGLGSGVYAVFKTRRAVQRFTPTGIRYQLGSLGVGARAFAHEVQEGMAEREHQLREQLHAQRLGEEQQRALEAPPTAAPAALDSAPPAGHNAAAPAGAAHDTAAAARD